MVSAGNNQGAYIFTYSHEPGEDYDYRKRIYKGELPYWRKRVNNFEWLQVQGLDRLPGFLSAMAIGLLMGLERERNPASTAGLRTFALVSLAGAAAATIASVMGAPSVITVGLGVITLMMIVANYNPHPIPEVDRGTTTIAAVIVCYLLAVLAQSGSTQLATMIAIIATSLLYFKTELHGAAHKMERRDLVSILQFAVLAFVALPLLPDQTFGPYDVLNPHHIWQMVVLISGVSLAGYAALRFFGREHGAALLGLLGGLVSSTATTLTYSRYAREAVNLTSLAATVIVSANLVLLVRLFILAAIVAPSSLTILAPVTGSALAVGILVSVLRWRNNAASSELTIPEIENPTELRTALGFAGFYAAVLLLTAWLADVAGSSGVYTAALISGLTDVDAITLSSLRLYDMGTLTRSQVAAVIVIAVSANSAFKLGIVRVVGGSDLFGRCLPTMVAVVLTAAITLWAFAWM